MVIQAVQEHAKRTVVAHWEHLHLQVSVDTVRGRLHAAGIHHRVPAGNGKLTDEHRAGQFALASQYVNQGIDFWSRAVFSDEKTFRSSDHGRKHVWMMNNTR